MAIRTGEIFNSLIFGGVNSADYGVYITGEATFNAPKRLVDMVSVPGRNGSIAIDQGHWDNIVVEYPAGFFGSDKADFREALSDFRNAIVSQLGYQRLTDTYHPDEYRIALYVEGIEVDPTAHNTAGEFTLKFNCKPQRWLTSGETAVTVSSGDTLTNPTQYASGPLLAVNGSGAITVGDYPINIYPISLGDISLLPKLEKEGAGNSINTHNPLTDCFASTLLNGGDVLTVGETSVTIVTDDSGNYQTVTVESSSGIDGVTVSRNLHGFTINIPSITLTYQGSSSSDPPNLREIDLGLRIRARRGGEYFQYTATVSLSIAVRNGRYSEQNVGQVFLYGSVTLGGSHNVSYWTTVINGVNGYSTKTALGNPTYVDCEIGEAYKVENGVTYSLNNVVGLGSDLPTLVPGENEITFGNTITSLSIIPRWWKL